MKSIIVKKAESKKKISEDFDGLQKVFACIVSYCRRRKFAAKCEGLIKQVQYRLEVQKKRRTAILLQSKVDIALFLQNGQLEQAIARIEQFYRDRCRISAYDLLDHFCACIIPNVPLICSESVLQNLPSDLSECVASLTYAASRCGEVPELHLLRNLFKGWYGSDSEAEDVILVLVNPHVKEKLSIQKAPDDVKYVITRELARDFTLRIDSQRMHRHLKPRFSELRTEDEDVQVNESRINLKSFLGNKKNLIKESKRSRGDRRQSENISSRQQLKVTGSADLPVEGGNCLHDSGDGSDLTKDHRVNMRKQCNASPSHVHPKLPDYDDLVAQLWSAQIRKPKKI